MLRRATETNIVAKLREESVKRRFASVEDARSKTEHIIRDKAAIFVRFGDFLASAGFGSANLSLTGGEKHRSCVVLGLSGRLAADGTLSIQQEAGSCATLLQKLSTMVNAIGTP